MVRKPQNQGITLIEVIVTVLIVGIVSGISVLSFQYINQMNSDQCAKQLSSLLDQTRMETMGMVKDSIFLRITKEEDGYEAITVRVVNEDGVITEKEVDRKKIGSKALQIYYEKAEVSYQVTKELPLEFHFAKESGKLLEEVTEVKVVGRKTNILRMVRETGRNYLQ